MARVLTVAGVVVVLCMSRAFAGENGPEDRSPLMQQARVRLAVLRNQVGEMQREIRELEVLTDDAKQIQVRIRMIECDADEARRCGLILTPGEQVAGVQPIPTSTEPQAEPSSPWRFVETEEITQLIKQLSDAGHAKTLAAPALVTDIGKPATTLSGGEFPTLVPQKGGAVSIEWKDFGVRTEATPNILDNGRVHIQFSAEVNDRDFTRQVKVQGMTIPGILSRRISSSVEMDLGKTAVMTGLTTFAAREKAIADKRPYISRLFQQASHEEETPRETAFIVLVTPKLVARPADSAAE